MGQCWITPEPLRDCQPHHTREADRSEGMWANVSSSWRFWDLAPRCVWRHFYRLEISRFRDAALRHNNLLPLAPARVTAHFRCHLYIADNFANRLRRRGGGRRLRAPMWSRRLSGPMVVVSGGGSMGIGGMGGCANETSTAARKEATSWMLERVRVPPNQMNCNGRRDK